ncbi:PWWP domain-containing protein 3-like [Euphorbia lathyris]|uniref:PWWP domain-containing protein 3-like n=1 Tax=Euphorbia lathyris TaxID=212925 RepID=UPI00331312E2
MEAAETHTVAERQSPSILRGSSDAGAKSSRDASQISPVKTARENDPRVSLNGKEDIGGSDLDRSVSGAQISGEAMGDTSNLKLGGNEGGLEDPDTNGMSSLLRMQETKSLPGLGTVLDVDKNEKRYIESSDGDGVSLVADVCGDIHSSDAKEKRDYGRGSQDKPLDGNEEIFDGKDDGSDMEEEENIGDEEHDFTVGDFVWGKIRSHPWWPGRIYDPLDASDFAKKVKQGDKILVAYFGDGTFAWCNPSQLKPLDNNFLEMSNQSSSRNFVNAVENAMDEIGRLVDLKMTCSCVPKDNLIGFGRTLVVNAGIKEGLLIPEGGIDKFSSVLFEPTELLTELKEAAQVATATRMLEFTVLKSWLSAFYRSKGGHQLPSYYDPKPVPGLEDKSRDWTDDYNGVEVRIQGPEEEYWISSPRGRKYGQTTQNPLHKCQGVAVDGHYQRRKRKSLAEILDGQPDVQAAEATTEISGGREKLSSQATPSTKRKKRKSTGESADDEGKIEANEVSGGGEKVSNQATSSIKRKKRKSVGESADDEGEIEANDGTAGEKLDKPTSTSGGKKGRSVKDDDERKIEVTDGTRGEELDKPTSTSGGKKGRSVKDDIVGKHKVEDAAKAVADSGKPRSSSVRNKRKGSDEADVDNKGGSDMLSESDGSGVKKSSVGHPSTRSWKKRNSNVTDDNGGSKNEERKENSNSAEKVDGSPSKSKELLRDNSLPRERKRSKYLSPPYTNLDIGRGKEIEAESLKMFNETRLGERLVKAASQLNGSPKVQLSGERSQNQLFKETGAVHGSDSSGHQTPNQAQTIDPLLVKATANEVLFKIRSAALNPLYLKDAHSLDMVGQFFSAFRSSTYCSESNGEYSEPPPGRKRKSQKSEPGSSAKEQTQTKTYNSSPDRKSQQEKIRKSEEAKKTNEPEEIQDATSTLDKKTKDKESNGEAPATALFVTFGPGSSLPSKNDLIKIYGKFGALNKQETEMFYTNYCARVVFLKSADAEEAFNVSQLSSPFGAANVTFRLRYLSAETKTRKLREISSHKPSSSSKEGAKTQELQSASESSDSKLSELNFIKQTLEGITSLIETSGGKISLDMKSALQGEINLVLEKVSRMASSS